MTTDDSIPRLDELVERAEEAGRAGEWDEAVAAWRAVLARPGAEHSLLDYEILDEIHQLLRRAGRHDEANRRQPRGDRRRLPLVARP